MRGGLRELYGLHGDRELLTTGMGLPLAVAYTRLVQKTRTKIAQPI
jgi:hypothetical protein